MRIRRPKKAQTTIEYSFLIVIIIGALIAMNLYFKRGIQGRWKQAIDGLGDQYDPGHMLTEMRYVLDSNSETFVWTNQVNGGFVSMRRDIVNSVDSRSGYTGVDAE